MSITPTFFNCFKADVGNAKHNLSSDSIRFLLTNTAPNAADTAVDTTTTTCTITGTSNAAEIAAGNGYTKKGFALTGQSFTQSAGTGKLACAAQPNWTSSTGNMGPFRYVVAYNDTGGTTSARPPICFWDKGASVTLDGTQGDAFTHAVDITNVLQDT